MTKRIFAILLLVNSLISSAQEAPSYKIYGFVRSDYTLDSRKVYSTAQELFYKNWKLGVEFEYTNAAWGTRSPTGSIIQTERVSNSRIYAIVAYTF